MGGGRKFDIARPGDGLVIGADALGRTGPILGSGDEKGRAGQRARALVQADPADGAAGKCSWE